MTNVCHFSPCQRYRYSLEHRWDDISASRRIAWIGLNPSTAAESNLDPTLRRIAAFSKSWGFTSFVMLNLFAFRATDPRVMKRQADPIGPENTAAILKIAGECEIVVAAWGTHGAHMDRANVIVDTLRYYAFPLVCLGVNADGSPKHPLYLKKTLPLQPFQP